MSNFNLKCTHCGQCCKSQICHVGRDIFPDRDEWDDECPAIRERGGKIFCGLIECPWAYVLISREHAQQFSQRAGTRLWAGRGCTNPHRMAS